MRIQGVRSWQKRRVPIVLNIRKLWINSIRPMNALQILIKSTAEPGNESYPIRERGTKLLIFFSIYFGGLYN